MVIGLKVKSRIWKWAYTAKYYTTTTFCIFMFFHFPDSKLSILKGFWPSPLLCSFVFKTPLGDKGRVSKSCVLCFEMNRL